ncbi:polysaccharide deacetylase family protein [Aurantibacter crassamenti]|uniref:polysaccharide deacetylase family protein n=1 Tax=Aurantibacter crassamenti TaxID=1837375 RepID=UPI00193A05E2|nr:polysaccharide deacetylase family protein [Aurantibacter crassamenti]MBM1105462.1 polysaccharide deacetylase family protein [Aurantibacter crassamenti]
MKTKLFFFFIIVHFSLLNAQKNGPKLIVRGDDMGYSHSGNLALLKSYKEGIETSIEVIVPAPWFPEAVKMLNDNPNVDVGIHLALTSEWDNVKWRPVSDCPSIKNADGYFYPMVFPNPNYPKESIKENQWNIEDVEKEFRAQIELGLKYIPRISHLSAHMGCAHLSEEVNAMTKRLAKEYGLFYDMSEYNVERPSYDASPKTYEGRLKSFITMLESLQPNKTYLFVEHPGLDNEELQAISHIGYEDVAAHRQDVTNLFTDQKVKDKILEKGIQLVNYKDVSK